VPSRPPFVNPSGEAELEQAGTADVVHSKRSTSESTKKKHRSSKGFRRLQAQSLASEEEVAGNGGQNERHNILEQIRPVNVENEKHKFFIKKYDYNPIFKYVNPLPPAVLAKYSVASDKYLMHVRIFLLVSATPVRLFSVLWIYYQAIKIMNNLIKKYGSYEKFEELTGGRLLTKFEIGCLVREYCQREGFADGEIVLNLSDDLLSTASMAHAQSWASQCQGRRNPRELDRGALEARTKYTLCEKHEQPAASLGEAWWQTKLRHVAA
jgi:hypothetical protein